MPKVFDKAAYMQEYRQKHSDEIHACTALWKKTHADKNREHSRKYRQAHLEEVRKRDRAYILQNKDKVKAKQRDWYERNRQYVIDKSSAWSKTPKGRLCRRVQVKRRQHMLLDLDTKTVQRVYEDNIKKYGTLTCTLCFEHVHFGEDSLEHDVPVSRKDEFPEVSINAYENLGVAHRICNVHKGTRTLKEYFAEKERLAA